MVPDGSCTATTVAPGMTAPCASLTTPLIALVVTPCAAASEAGQSKDESARMTSNPKVLRFMFSPETGMKGKPEDGRERRNCSARMDRKYTRWIATKS